MADARRQTPITFKLGFPRWPGSCLKDSVKFDVQKVHRSNIYHLLNTIVPRNHRKQAESDALGIVIILGLIMGLVSLVRFILNCTH